MALERINLNLVPVLRSLLRERSVSAAAASLGRSPSAISESLSQLREILGDQLLVRVGGHLHLTPKAAELAEPLEDLNERLQSLFRRARFEPSTSTRTFTIASSDLLINELGPDIVRALRTDAPGMAVHFVDIAAGLTEKLAAREIDFALLPEFAVYDLAPAPIKFQALSCGESVALMSRNHPLAHHASVSKAELQEYQHIAFRPDAVLTEGRRKLPAVGVLEYEGSRHFNIAVAVSQFLTIPRLLEGTSLVAIVPNRIAEAAFRSATVVAVKLGYESDRYSLGLAWSPVQDRDDAHAWLRKMLTERRSGGSRSPVSVAREPVEAVPQNQMSLSE